jgi:hypothetical protein
MAPSRLRGVSGNADTLVGEVAFVAVAEGSHSAHQGPVLRTPQGEARLYAVGDNPFENASWRPLDGVRVRVMGRWRNGVLRVEPAEIELFSPPEEVEPPAVSPEAPRAEPETEEMP